MLTPEPPYPWATRHARISPLVQFEVGLCPIGNVELLELLECADKEFLKRYPELDGRRRGQLSPDARFVTARRNGTARGCCALQQGGEPTVRNGYEVKRLYVRPGDRGTGAVDALMQAIENLATHLSASSIYFETGIRQPEAIRVVLRHGYKLVEPYPPYLDDPFARCYAKPHWLRSIRFACDGNVPCDYTGR